MCTWGSLHVVAYVELCVPVSGCAAVGSAVAVYCGRQGCADRVVLGAQGVTVFGADAGGDGKGHAFLPAALSRPVSRCPWPPRLGAAS